MDSERISRIQDGLRFAGLSALICSLPSHVLLLTGYWPIVGESIAICLRDGPIVLLVPEDEEQLAGTGFADSVHTFTPVTLNEMRTVIEAVKPRFDDIIRKLKFKSGPIGIESGAGSQAASYLAIHLFGNKLPAMLHELLPESKLSPADDLLGELSSIKTSAELDRIRQACAIAKNAYEAGASHLRSGIIEPEAAEMFRAPLTRKLGGREIHRSDGCAFCMSGPNSAKAYAAYARTRWRTLESKDLVMIHCNSYVDGFWTDITRTFTLRPPDQQQKEMYDAVFAARKTALKTIQPGVRASDVDTAARRVIQNAGLGQYLKHGTGHGVGFSPMSAYSIPQIHAQSAHILQRGMVFNVEPALYIEDYGGVRHCDMVAVTEAGCELLTDFQSDMKSLALINEEKEFVERKSWQRQ